MNSFSPLVTLLLTKYGNLNILVKMKMSKINKTDTCFCYETQVLPLYHLKVCLFSFHI